MKTPRQGRGFPPRYNATPDPPGGFVAVTDIPRLTGPFGQRCAL